MKSPNEVVNIMLEKDAFSQWMNLEVTALDKGSCTLKCIIKAEMLNGFQIAHGGIAYSLSDSALAFSANSYGYKSVSIETSISHLRPVKLDDELTVECTEIHRGRTLGIYSVAITNQENKLISNFKGTVNISPELW